MAYLLDLLASILEEPELGGRGQAHGECILSSWQLLNIKDGMVWLQEDRAQVCNQRPLPQLLYPQTKNTQWSGQSNG